MKAVIIDELGTVPRWCDVPEPPLAEGQVMGTVRAAAVKNIERMMVAGTHYSSAQLSLPAPVGVDAVVALPDGRRVYTGATAPNGAMAQRLPVDPARGIEVPDGVDDAAAAALPNAAGSAWFGLEFAGELQAGQHVLLLGATGVTGTLAVQLAKHRFGAGRVTAVGRNPERLDRLCALGADHTIRIGADSREWSAAVSAAHAERPFDVVIDYLWGAPAQLVLECLGNSDLDAGFHRTRYVQVGESAGSTIELPAAVLRSAGVSLLGQGAGSVPPEAFRRLGTEILPALFAMLAEGTLSVATVTRPFAEVSGVWNESVESGTRVVLTP